MRHVVAKGLPFLHILGPPLGGTGGASGSVEGTMVALLPLQEEAVGPWYHPGAQEIQPLFGEGEQGGVKMHSCLADAWNGGGSLLLQGTIPPEVRDVAVR